MAVTMQNPGWQAGGSLDQYGGLVSSTFTALDLQAQTFASRFSLSPWMARDVARLCFGEGNHD